MTTLKIILRRIKARDVADTDYCSYNSDWFVHKTMETFLLETSNQTKHETQVFFFIKSKIRIFIFIPRILDVLKSNQEPD